MSRRGGIEMTLKEVLEYVNAREELHDWKKSAGRRRLRKKRNETARKSLPT